MSDFRVPFGPSETEFTEKRSRFIGHLLPVETEEQAREFIAQMKKKYYDARHNCWCYLIGGDTMREVERQLMLDIIDQHWIRHLTELDDLRQGIGLRAMAQQDPLVAYRTEASMLWQEMTNTIK